MTLRNTPCSDHRPYSSRTLKKSPLALLLLLALLFAGEAFGAQTVRKDAFITQLFQARGFAAPAGEKDMVRAALELDLIPVPEGRLDAPITMKEAIVFAVHSLGLASVADVLSGAPLPFRDIGRLKPLERGYLAAALNMNPPLLRKGVTSFGPSKKLTPKEARNIAAIVRAARKGLSLSVKYSPMKGMTVQVNREGVHDRPPKWRAAVNGFDSREEAEFFRDALAEKGVEGTVDSQNFDWRVRSALSETYGPIRGFLAACESLGRNGVVFASPASWDTQGAPRFWVMVILDPARFDIRPVFAPEGLYALAPLSSMTTGAAAAVNGGYFSISGKERGAPIGAVIERGVMVNPPYKGRTILGWNGKNQAAFGQMDWRAEVHFPGGGFMDVTGLNRTVKGDGVILFTRHFGECTPVFSGPVVEAVLDGDTCVEVRREGGNPIPPGKRVLAVYGTPARFAESVTPGDRVRIVQTVNGGDPYWTSMTNAVQGGPFLVRKGVLSMETENLNDSIVNKRHPRSVIGLTEKGQWFFFVGDGRNAVHSVGFTLAETAEILKKNGVSYALNLDGGGSSTLYAGGRIMNVLSDGRERPVSYGVGAFPKGGK